MEVKVKKFLFVGLNEHKRKFFEEAQKLGVIDFINTSRVQSSTETFSDLILALKTLRTFGKANQTQDIERPAEKLVQEILSLKAELEFLDDKIRLLKEEAEETQPFGNFSWDDIRAIEKAGNIKVRFYCAKKEKLQEDNSLIEVSTNGDLNYFICFSEVPVKNAHEVKITRSLHDVRSAIEETTLLLHRRLKELSNYVHYFDFLHNTLFTLLSENELSQAETLSEEPFKGVFTVQGWIPDTKIASVTEVAEKYSLVMEESLIEDSDRVPTYLENEKAGKIGEDLVDIYDTPSVTDKDPSLWVLGAFGIFFAFIVGDGGYGAVYLGLCLWALWRFPEWTGVKKRMLHLGVFLSSCCIIWGFLISSFFGIGLSIENPLRAYSPLTWLVEHKANWLIHHTETPHLTWMKTNPYLSSTADGSVVIKTCPDVLCSLVDNVLLELAILFGVLHCMTGMFRYLKRNWSLLGWIVFLVGSYLYFPFYLGVPSILNYVFHVDFVKGAEVGLQLVYGGIVLALGISIYRFKWMGLTEVMNLIQVFSDVLSYLRLYALGLAGGIVAGVINDAANGLPAILAILLFALAHVVNMVLGIMSGVIHGLRLNFIEWYHYSFEGGGKKFKPLILYKND